MDVGKKEIMPMYSDSSSYRPQNDKDSIANWDVQVEKCRLCHSERSLRSEESVDIGKKETILMYSDSSSYCPQNDRDSIR